MQPATDSIVAQATAIGRGGVGIVRVSGPQAKTVAAQLLEKVPPPRLAQFCDFKNADGEVLDQGVAVFFQGPHSFTGEDVLELQGHGGQVVLDSLIQACLQVDKVRLARPGEFSERAFLNDKLDLAQAEAIADLIDADSQQAARSAVRSLQGAFSQSIHALVEQLIQLRIYVEAAIDFPEEEIDFLADGKVSADVDALLAQLQNIRAQAKQGSLLKEGMRVVIAGRPNAGKSSLLNRLVDREAAIVTDIAGTTRDVLQEHMHIDGMPLHIIDTAGLRDSNDKVEQLGIERAWAQMQDADRVLLILDASQPDEHAAIQAELQQRLPANVGLTLVLNKIDLCAELAPKPTQEAQIQLSAHTGEGISELREHLKACMGFDSHSEGQFIARRRHVEALDNAAEHILLGQTQLQEHNAGELLAEELRLAQQHLSSITGEFSSDDLLGKIFSSFCIGK